MKSRWLVLLLLGRLAGIGVMVIPFWHRTPAAAPARQYPAYPAVTSYVSSVSPCQSTDPCLVLCGLISGRSAC